MAAGPARPLYSSSSTRYQAGLRPALPSLQAWQRYNTPPLDFNLTFDTHNLSRLQAAMAAEERQLLPMSLDPLTWDTYMSQYMTAVQRIFLKQAV